MKDVENKDQARPSDRPVLRRLVAARHSLSGKLILLTIAVVMAAEVFIYVPSIARFRAAWLDEKLASAQIAVLALQEAPEGMVSDELTNELLENAGVFSVKLINQDSSALFLSEDMPPMPQKWVDLRSRMAPELIAAAFDTLLHGEGRNIGVRGAARFRPGGEVEIVIDETPLCAAMTSYSRNILALSLVIALATAFFVYLSLMRLTVRPMQKITQSMERFRQHPEDGRFVIEPSRREDEVGRTERELYDMQRDLQAALQQRTRLAHLGEAVSKINHDLRNILTSAQLVSDQLVHSDDPKVQRLGPRLFSAIDRAIALCSETLKYGKAEEAPPHFTRVRLGSVVDEVQALLGLSPLSDPRLEVAVDEGLIVEADEDKLHRILVNLLRNARDAHLAGEAGATDRVIGLEARVEGDQVLVDVTDNGPGIPDRVRESLFKPFAASGRSGGTGLGLAISKELAEAQGGSLVLIETCDDGTRFRLCLPL